ncbi:hypothetical protein Prudu_020874 [Prunus dulcis]|uniref:Uncharacterized protein n=1 Tax=Prunus dulcis TaxID=3755 RepID=A0A4Y1RW80_PRUDU|nr:hypothetical protein Prudu_020874 [Prunus dulcis]
MSSEEDVFCLGKHIENVRDIDGAVRGFLILGVMIDLVPLHDRRTLRVSPHAILSYVAPMGNPLPVPTCFTSGSTTQGQGYVSCRIMVIFSSVEHQYVAICSSV